MLFNSFNFFLVYPVIFVIYWIIPTRYNKARNVFLLLVSYLLYMNWKPAFALALFGVTTVCYLGGICIDNRNAFRKKAICTIFAIIGLLPLLVFKYYNFLNDSITTGLSNIGLHFALPGLNWAIPIGISFFTFQAVGYVLDVYHKRIPAEKDFLDYALFVSFFPQVTSGPISTAKDLMPQFKCPHTFRYDQARDGLKLFVWGLFVKLVIADRMGMYVDTVYANFGHYSGNQCLIASVFYTIQIYCDFAGYSWMAVGIAKTLGFDLINNFRQPYFATSITDFWKRWHISLTRWLTTHVYINMGGNRCSKLRQYWNILVTFLVSGLWHGANWTFVFWGILHGILQIVEKALGIDPKGKYANSNLLKKLNPIRCLVTFASVNMAWIFFRMPTTADSFDVIKRMLTDRGSVDIASIYTGSAPVLILFVAVVVMIIKDLFSEFSISTKAHIPSFIRRGFYIFVIVFTLAAGVLDGGQFIYVSF